MQGSVVSPYSEASRCSICDQDIYMTSRDSCMDGPGLTKTEWELLLGAIHAYYHNKDYRTLHDKLTIIARASGIKPKGSTLIGSEARRVG